MMSGISFKIISEPLPPLPKSVVFLYTGHKCFKISFTKKKSFTITLKISNTYKQITNGMQDFNTENYKTLEKF